MAKMEILDLSQDIDSNIPADNIYNDEEEYNNIKL